MFVLFILDCDRVWVKLSIGEADMALGSDQGGSLRVPASWTGVVGLKPTYGLVPYTGAIGGDPAIDHLGPMARTVEDCALLLEVLQNSLLFMTDDMFGIVKYTAD